MQRDPLVFAADRSIAKAAILPVSPRGGAGGHGRRGSGKFIGMLTRLDLFRSLFTFIRSNDPVWGTSCAASRRDLAELHLIAEGRLADSMR